MELYRYRAATNFGDQMNDWFWDAVCPGWREAGDGFLVGIGTILNAKLPAGVRKVVMGSGAGYGPPPGARLLGECEIRCVRGPRTAAALGLPAALAATDPAVLAADMPEFAGRAVWGRPIFVPHHVTFWFASPERVADEAGVDLVLPQQDSREVIRRIASAPLVLAESMHAAILADAFGTPWHAVVVSPLINRWKWLDWGESIGLEPLFHSALPDGFRCHGVRHRQVAGAPAPVVDVDTSRLARLRRRLQRRAIERRAAGLLSRLAGKPGQLSDRARLEEAKARLRDRLRP